MHILLSKGTS